mgnify:FL=1
MPTSPNFIASDLPGFEDPELLRPRQLYERQGRMDEYAQIVATLKVDRHDYIQSFPGLDPSIVAAL